MSEATKQTIHLDGFTAQRKKCELLIYQLLEYSFYNYK